jgi:hypothetical protein
MTKQDQNATAAPAVGTPVDQRVGRLVPKREDWRAPTTYLQRFGDAVALLCRGRKAHAGMLAGWLDGSDDSLQHFAIDNGPAWAQGIVILDAAALLADTPGEGVEHAARPKTPND